MALPQVTLEDGRVAIRVTLKRAIEAHGKQVSELVIREPTAKELEAMQRGKGGEISQLNHLLAECAQIPYSSVLKLRAGDWRKALEALQSFDFLDADEPSEESSTPSPQTGESS